jgi:arylsulfatase A-like enzyme
MPDVVTLPQYFKNHGYYTAGIGKLYHHTNEMQDDRSWSENPVKFVEYAIKDEYRLKANIEGYKKTERKAEAAGLKGGALHNSSLGGAPPYEKANLPDEAYHDGKIAREAVLKLKRLAENSKPFFLGVGFHKPHLIYSCPEKYWDLYDPDRIPPAPNPFIPENYPEGYYYNSTYARRFKDMPKTGPFSEKTVRKMRHGYCACVSFVDAQIGKVLNELDRLKLRDNTIIILWGDHGYLQNDHGIFGKHNNFERAVRTPMIISAPGISGNKSTSALTEFVDIYPSLCELAAIPVPDRIEGRSLVPLLNDPARSWKEAAFSQYPAKWAMGYSIRTKRYRYTEWRRKKNKKVTARAFFDYEKDPHETKNLVDEPSYKKTIIKIKAMLDQM